MSQALQRGAITARLIEEERLVGRAENSLWFATQYAVHICRRDCRHKKKPPKKAAAAMIGCPTRAGIFYKKLRTRQWLGGRDSNPDRQIQNLQSYRWTTSQEQTTRTRQNYSTTYAPRLRNPALRKTVFGMAPAIRQSPATIPPPARVRGLRSARGPLP